ncbi:hypothetical protein [Sciscionella marina]|uniref:hypothetical protein n=1 Tax=Sciscionella marina TaxID=508770 RepID=UPI0003668999|nr:hypothetical protein [Sciscionella marina]
MTILVLLVVATAALVVGLFTHVLGLVWVALGVSLLAIGLLALRRILHRRRQVEHATETEERPDEAPIEEALETGQESNLPSTTAEQPEDEKPKGTQAPQEEAGPGNENPPPSDTVSSFGVARSAELVRIIEGRRRYHLPGCRTLQEHTYEEITRDEAQDEGFTACTVCATS